MPQGSREMFDDQEDEDFVPKNKKRKQVGKNFELLEIEAETQATQTAIPEMVSETPNEITPNSLLEPAVVSEIVPEKPTEIATPPKTKIRMGVENTRINSGVVWYEGILDDLKTISSQNDEPNEKDWRLRHETATKMKHKGINLPPMAVGGGDPSGNFNREKIRTAVEFLEDEKLLRVVNGWESREKAIAYLKSIGIGRGGTPFLPGSEEAGMTEKKVGSVDTAVNEHGERERRANILSRLAAYSNTEDEEEKETYLSALKLDGVDLKKFLDDEKPEFSNDLSWLRAVAKWEMMSAEEKQEYPKIPELAEYVTKKLGLQ